MRKVVLGLAVLVGCSSAPVGEDAVPTPVSLAPTGAYDPQNEPSEHESYEIGPGATTTSAPPDMTYESPETTIAQPRPAQKEVSRPAPTFLEETPRITSDLPPEYVKQCESGGDYTAVNPNGHYGAWQFSQSTWESVGGTGRPDQASPAEQDYRASILWDGGNGASHWSCY